MLAKHFFCTLACFLCGYSAQMSAQSTPARADNTSPKTASAISALSATGAQSSATTQVIRYDGVLKGQPSSTGIAVIFSVYGSDDSTHPLWQETQNVQPGQDGRYTAFIGASNSGGLPSFILDATEPQWLGVRVNGEANEQKTLLVRALYSGKALPASMPTAAKSIGSSNSLLLVQSKTRVV